MSTDLYIVWLIVGMTCVSICARSFFLVFGERFKVADWVLEAIRFAPLAAMVAILAPEIFLPSGASSVAQFDLKLPNIWGGIAAMVAFYFTKKMIPTLVAGMIVYTAAKAFIS
jgi:branched-subunit amino acid transport protein